MTENRINPIQPETSRNDRAISFAGEDLKTQYENIILILANTDLPGKIEHITSNGKLSIRSEIELCLGNKITVQAMGSTTDLANIKQGDRVAFRLQGQLKKVLLANGLHIEQEFSDMRIVSKEEIETLKIKVLDLISYQEREKLIKAHNKIQQKYQDLEQEYARRHYSLGTEYTNKKTELQKESENLKEEREAILLDREDLISKQEHINKQRIDIEATKEELIEIEQKISRYASLLTLVDDREQEAIVEHSTIPKTTELEPEDLGERWSEMLASKNQILPDSIEIGYLLSMMTALCSGSIVLLNGTVGVGKSSIVRKSAELLGGKAEIIPIRPSWLDSSDLLGFFDPLSETFRPSTFTTALKTANKYSDRPFFRLSLI